MLFTSRKTRKNLVTAFAVVMLIVSLISLVLLATTIWTGLKLLSIGNEIGYMEHTNSVSLYYWTPERIQHYEELIAERSAIYNSSNHWVAFVSTAPNWAQLLIPTILFATLVGGLVMSSTAAEAVWDTRK